jgi:hypothetical protein
MLLQIVKHYFPEIAYLYAVQISGPFRDNRPSRNFREMPPEKTRKPEIIFA